MKKKDIIPPDKKVYLKVNYLAGFSLIEVMVATIILSLIASSLTYVFIAGKKHTAHTRLKARAIELSRFYLSPLQEKVRQDQWGSNCLSGDLTDCPKTPTNDTDMEVIYQPNTTVDRNYAGTALSKVKLTISWNETAP